jgi:hypothetical protein
MNKFLRELSFMGIRNRVNKLYPGYDQYLTASRLPAVPRLVLYAQEDSEGEIVRRVFPNMQWVRPEGEGKPDEEVTRAIAQRLTTPSIYSGFVVQGFPVNVRQALLLDQYLNGINLAFYARKKGNKEY